MALQFLGNLFEYFLKKRGKQDFLTIVGATSGDTGRFLFYFLMMKVSVINLNIFNYNLSNLFSKYK